MFMLALLFCIETDMTKRESLGLYLVLEPVYRLKAFKNKY